MSYQDWKPVILNKSRPPAIIEQQKLANKKKLNSGKNSQSMQDINRRKLENDDSYKFSTVTHDLKTQIQQARQNKKMTQAELAQKCNLSLRIIQDYEKGIGVVNSAHLSKIGKILDVQLKKPKAIAINED